MVTRKELKWLDSLPKDSSGKIIKCEDTTRYNTYMKRLHMMINKDIELLLKITKDYPDIYIGSKEQWVVDGHVEPQFRIRGLMKALNNLSQNFDVELVRKDIP